MSQDKKLDHQCVICGEFYHSCDLCKEIQMYTPWRSLCDNSRHFQVYQIIAMLRGNVMNTAEAKDSLNHIGITVDEIKTFIPAVQEILLPIMEEKPKSNVEVIFVEEDDESDEEI